MNLKLEKLESNFKEKRVRICFGSKDLFHKQFNLEENAITFKEWKQDYIILFPYKKTSKRNFRRKIPF
jgi:hypothetical protein